MALLTAFAFGRFSAPAKVKTETKIVEVEKKTEKTNTDKQTHKKTEIVTIIKPDGTKETHTVITDNSDAKSKQSETDNTSITEDKTKEVTYSQSKVTVSALAGFNIFSPSLPDYGLSITKPVLGPITVGIFGFRSGMAGCSVGLTF